MIHNLTKFQKDCWNLIKSHLIEEYDVTITYDDELQISFGIENGRIVIDIFPKNQVLFKIKYDDGHSKKSLFNHDNLEDLLEILNKNEYK